MVLEKAWTQRLRTKILRNIRETVPISVIVADNIIFSQQTVVADMILKIFHSSLEGILNKGLYTALCIYSLNTKNILLDLIYNILNRNL
jgi:hypothetical protein